jgi:hypothetical protein
MLYLYVRKVLTDMEFREIDHLHRIPNREVLRTSDLCKLCQLGQLFGLCPHFFV